MTINDFLKNHPTLVNAEDFTQLTAPLNKLGISYFAHLRKNTNGQFNANSNFPVFFEQWIRRDYFNYGVMLAEVANDSLFLWDKADLKGSSSELYQFTQECGVNHLCTLIKQDSDYMHYYHFGSLTKNECINSLYSEHSELLHKFIMYYSEQYRLNDNLYRTNHLTCAVKTKNDAAWNSKSLTNTSALLETYKTNYASTDKKHQGTIQVTRREYQCGYYFIRGFTTLEIGQKLGISARTVQVYLERLCNRLGSNSKIELVRNFLEAAIQLPE